MRKILLAITLISMFSLSLPAQEQLSFEEMFRWFPEGKYEGITFKDNDAANTMAGFTILKDVSYGFVRWDEDVMAPGTLKNHWLNMTQMQSVKVVVSVDGSDKIDAGRGGRVMRYKLGDKLYNANSFGFKMQVINFPPEVDLVALALAQECVRKETEVLGEFQLYFADIENPSKQITDFYFCITPENQILASSSKEMLTKMVAAGSGLQTSVVAEFPFPEARELLPSLNQSWKLMYWGSMLKAIFLKAEKDEVDNSNLDRVRSSLEGMPPRITDYQFSDIPVVRTYHLHSDSESAKKDYSNSKQYEGKRRPQVSQPESAWWRDLNTRYSLDGNLFVETLTYTEPVTKKMKELLALENMGRDEILAKHKAQQEKAKKENKQEKAK